MFHRRIRREAQHAVLFQEAFATIGPAADLASLPNENARFILLQSRKQFRKILHDLSSRRGLLGRSAYFDWITNASINAHVTRSGDLYLIGVNAGVSMVLEILFFALMSDASLLPDIGEPSEESVSFRELSSFDWSQNVYPQMIDWLRSNIERSGGWCGRPHDVRRLEFACDLVWYAVKFIFSHEVGHILHGHVDYMQQVMGRRGIDELGMAAHLDYDVAQALELDADKFAATALMTADIMGDKSWREHARMFCIAMSIVFFVFDQSATKIERYQRSDHPHPSVRLATMIGGIAVAIMETADVPRDTVTEELERVLDECMGILGTLGEAAVSMSLTHQIAECVERGRRLTAVLSGLRPQLEQAMRRH